MRLGGRLVDGEFLERPNRYLARARVAGETVFAHVPDPGRLPGLLIPGRRVRLVYQPNPKRKTDYTLVLVRHGSIWVSVFPVFANRLVEGGLEENNIACLSGYESYQREVKEGNSRFDFLLRYPKGIAYVEVKSVSLVEDGVGKFPDAPTERGRRHVLELTALRKQGTRAVVLFVSQRSDTKIITGNDAIDPKFGDCLRDARSAGVELYGYNCRVTASTVSLNRPVEVVV
ncbi:MAG: DNA/RNA nuclease SfsA [Nitrospinales bacterium]